MGIITWLVVGLIAGVLGKFLMPGKDPGGFFMTILLGIGGGMIGGWMGREFLGLGDVSGFNLKSIALATGGAVLLLFLYRLIKKKG